VAGHLRQPAVQCVVDSWREDERLIVEQRPELAGRVVVDVADERVRAANATRHFVGA
jgi:hypothetical protein